MSISALKILVGLAYAYFLKNLFQQDLFQFIYPNKGAALIYYDADMFELKRLRYNA